MKLYELPSSLGTKKQTKRKGRGHGSGQGKTAGKGHKGQNARAGGGTRPGFEGGQMPLHRRVPKRGFNNKNFAKVYEIVNLLQLNIFEDNTIVTNELLISSGIVKKICDGIKILGNGDLNKKLTIKAKKFSKSALTKIEDAGGKAEVI